MTKPKHDFPAAIALGILSVSAYAVLRWFQIGAMIQGYVESEQDWGDGRSGLANILLMFASPPMCLAGGWGVALLVHSFRKAKRQAQSRWTFLRTVSVFFMIPFFLWIGFWVWILVRLLGLAFQS